MPPTRDEDLTLVRAAAGRWQAMVEASARIEDNLAAALDAEGRHERAAEHRGLADGRRDEALALQRACERVSAPAIGNAFRWGGPRPASTPPWFFFDEAFTNVPTTGSAILAKALAGLHKTSADDRENVDAIAKVLEPTAFTELHHEFGDMRAARAQARATARQVLRTLADRRACAQDDQAITDDPTDEAPDERPDDGMVPYEFALPIPPGMPRWESELEAFARDAVGKTIRIYGVDGTANCDIGTIQSAAAVNGKVMCTARIARTWHKLLTDHGATLRMTGAPR